MSSYGWSGPNPFLDTGNQSFTTAQFQQSLSQLPLPEDIFDMPNPMKPMGSDPNLKLPNEPLTNIKEPDNFDELLFDLGITENPENLGVQPSQELVDESFFMQKRGHKRKISGSGIFGFIGTGDDTQLVLPGMENSPINMNQIPSIFNERKSSSAYDYGNDLLSNSPMPVIKPEDLIINNKTDRSNNTNRPDYYVSNSNFKFPSSKDTSYIQQNESQLRTPVKTIESTDDLSKQLSSFANKSEAKAMPNIIPTQFVSPSTKSPLRSSIFTSSPLKPKQFTLDRNVNSNNTPNGDETISEFATPLKVKSTFISYKTPSPNKTPTKIAWFPTLTTKKNTITEKLLKEQRITPVKKKKSTITSTLATGTLDKYFAGPFNEKYICKFQNKETGTICEREFTRISNVRAHVQTHLCDRPFICQVCTKSFVRNHDLRRHAKVHEEFKHECPCGKKFPRHDAMRKHRMRNICKGGYINGDQDERPHQPQKQSLPQSQIQIQQQQELAKHHNIYQQSQQLAKRQKMENQDLKLSQQRLLLLQQQQKQLESEILIEKQQLQHANHISMPMQAQEANMPQDPIISVIDPSNTNTLPLPSQAIDMFDIDQNFSFNFVP